MFVGRKMQPKNTFSAGVVEINPVLCSQHEISLLVFRYAVGFLVKEFLNHGIDMSEVIPVVPEQAVIGTDPYKAF